jgi:tRNA A37 threonylcarbamoyladenosine biosynthesis protein TsaE
MKRFEITGEENKNGFKNFFHFDCYRIISQKDIIDLGWEKIISSPKNIIAVEWAEMIKKIIPKSAIKIKFDFIGKNKRGISIRK